MRIDSDFITVAALCLLVFSAMAVVYMLEMPKSQVCHRPGADVIVTCP